MKNIIKRYTFCIEKVSVFKTYGMFLAKVHNIIYYKYETLRYQNGHAYLPFSKKEVLTEIASLYVRL